MKDVARKAKSTSSNHENSTTQGSVTSSIVSVGDTVLHAKFGKGKVLGIEGQSPNEKATVFFPSVGQKQLLLKFAKLEVLG